MVRGVYNELTSLFFSFCRLFNFLSRIADAITKQLNNATNISISSNKTLRHDKELADSRVATAYNHHSELIDTRDILQVP